MQRLLIHSIFITCVIFIMAFSAKAADIQGLWVTKNGESLVKITPCQNELCGQIVWLRDDAKSGKVTKDKKNKNRALRSQPLLGLNLLSSVEQRKANYWQGDIYNPGDGRSYTAKLTLLSNYTLEVSGCALAGIVCKEQLWYRISEASGDVTGRWYVGNAKIQADVEKCGQQLCAKVIWAQAGEPAHLLGMELLNNVKKEGSSWKGDAIHPYEQKTYKATISQVDGNKIQLRACLGGVLCDSLFWLRAAQ